MFAVYGTAHTLWGGSSGGGGSFLFGALSVVGLNIMKYDSLNQAIIIIFISDNIQLLCKY